MRIALIIIGTVCIPAFIIGLFIFAARRLAKHYAPAADSNEALKNWLLCNPGKSIDDYLEGK